MNFNARRNIFTCCFITFSTLFLLLVRWDIFTIHYENFNIQIDQINSTQPGAKNDNLIEKFQKRRQFIEKVCQSKGYSDQERRRRTFPVVFVGKNRSHVLHVCSHFFN